MKYQLKQLTSCNKLSVVPPVGMYHNINKFISSLISHKNKLPKNNIYTCHYEYYLDSGRSALLLSLMTLSEMHPNKKQVVIPAYTCYSVAAVVEKAGLSLVLCDIDITTLDFDINMLESVLCEGTLAVVSVSLFGILPDLQTVNNLSHKNGAYHIFDSAQRISPEKDGPLDLLVLSFGRGKPLSAMGGGAVMTDSDDLSENIHSNYINLKKESNASMCLSIIKMLINDLFISSRLYWFPSHLKILGLGESRYPNINKPKQMHEIKKAFIRYRINSLKDTVSKRQEGVFEYNKADLVNVLNKVAERMYAPARYPVYLNRKLSDLDSKTIELAKKNGIVRMYPKSISELTEIKSFCLNSENQFSNAEWVAQHLMTLPLTSSIKKRDRVKIIQNYKEQIFSEKRSASQVN